MNRVSHEFDQHWSINRLNLLKFSNNDGPLDGTAADFAKFYFLAMQATILCCLGLIASTMAAGTVVRPKDSTGTYWNPNGLDINMVTMSHKGYRLRGGYLTRFRTAPYPEGCFMACVKSNKNDGSYKKGCESWSYQKSTKTCRLFKNRAYESDGKRSCVKWVKANSDWVSGWIFFGEDGAEDHSVCKK